LAASQTLIPIDIRAAQGVRLAQVVVVSVPEG
jgi:hypothetical protein